MKNLTDPLKVEIQATTSWWVKAIVADVKQKIV